MGHSAVIIIINCLCVCVCVCLFVCMHEKERERERESEESLIEIILVRIISQCSSKKLHFLFSLNHKIQFYHIYIY